MQNEYFDDDEIKYCKYEKYVDGEKQVAYGNDDRGFSFYFVKIKSMKNKRFQNSSSNPNHYINIPMITFTEIRHLVDYLMIINITMKRTYEKNLIFYFLYGVEFIFSTKQ